MPASPSFAINGGGSLLKASVAVGGAVQGILDSTEGVRTVEWTIIRTDDTTAPGAYVLVQSGSVGQQVDTTALSAGTSAALQCRINGGIDPQTGTPSAAMTAVAKFFVPTNDGLEVLSAGELEDDNRESSLTHGAVEPINRIIREGSGLGDFKASVRLATDAALPAYTRVGNVLTAMANGALMVDGLAVAIDDRILNKDSAVGEDNGIFDATDPGSAGSPFVITRSADAEADTDVTASMIVPVSEGTVNQDTAWMLATNDPIVLNTTALTFVPFGVVPALVTVADAGTVNPLGILNTVFQSDGATAGGVWRSELRIGAIPATSGDIRLSNSSLVRARNAANTANVDVFIVSGSDSVLIGDIVECTGTILEAKPTTGRHRQLIGIVDVASQTLTELLWRFDNLTWELAQSPVITIQDDPGMAAVGNHMTIRAQNAPAGTGGDLLLRATSGGTNDGVVHLVDSGGTSVASASSAQGLHTFQQVRHQKTILVGPFVHAVGVLDHVLLCDTAGGGVTVQLPPSATNDERVLVVKDRDGNAAANNIAILGDGGSLIDGAGAFIIATNRGAVNIICDGANWSVY